MDKPQNAPDFMWTIALSGAARRRGEHGETDILV